MTEPDLFEDLFEDIEFCNWCQDFGEMQSFGGLLFCDESCYQDYSAEFGDTGA